MSLSENTTSPPASNQGGLSYFEQRMQLLGITSQENKVDLWQNDPENAGKDKLISIPVFTEGKKYPGIDIHVYTLDRTQINYKPDGSRWSQQYCLTRLKESRVNKDGSVQKYHIPKGAGTYPFFHPSLIEKFEKKEKIDVLFITEGFFKAWKGCMHGLDVIGVSSITHLKEKDTGLLHIDIRRLRDICCVKRIVWLTDGDCLDITNKELTDGVDLFKRPFSFFRSCETFKKLLDDWEGDKWFFHIDTDNILANGLFSPGAGKKLNRGDVKGLDDLLITFRDHIPEIIADAKTVAGNSSYFAKQNISYDTRRIYSYFHLINVNDFYLFHRQRRPEIEKTQFVFNGTHYQYSEKENECKVIVPAAAKLYFRVGDNYYKFVERVNEEGDIELGFEKRLKSTITDDHGRKFCEHIPKYEVFTNKPGHVAYQQVINNNFNLYHPLPFEPVDDKCNEEDCPYIISFLKHVFGEKLISIKQADGSFIKTAYYQVAIDYIQILYHHPVQRLPILCPVSKENETGKSSLGNLLKGIFGDNAVTVGNSDLADDFNSFWASRLLIMCDETKIDKMVVVERVKALTFQKRIGLHAKGKDKSEIPFFGKFILFSNNEDNFIFANEEDLRYWVIKVPKIEKKDPDYEKKMLEEIPDFLSFLNHRKIICPRVNRMWFDEDLLRTEALKRVILNSYSTAKKELTHHLKETFLDFGVQEILMTCRAIRDNYFRHKEENYIYRVLKDEMKMIPVQCWLFKDKIYDSDEEAIEAAMKSGLNQMEAMDQIKRQGKVMRHSYPRWEMKPVEIGKPMERVAILVKEPPGRPYRFFRKDFINADEEVQITDEIRFINEMQPDFKANGQSSIANDEPIDELPF